MAKLLLAYPIFCDRDAKIITGVRMFVCDNDEVMLIIHRPASRENHSRTIVETFDSVESHELEQFIHEFRKETEACRIYMNGRCTWQKMLQFLRGIFDDPKREFIFRSRSTRRTLQ